MLSPDSSCYAAGDSAQLEENCRAAWGCSGENSFIILGACQKSEFNPGRFRNIRQFIAIDIEPEIVCDDLSWFAQPCGPPRDGII